MLTREIVAIVNDAKFRQHNLLEGALEPVGNSPEDFTRFIEDDRAVFKKVVREADIERQ
jgi:tripartite-type tricarboxylate transporter receptor subunit TctC